MEKNKCAILVLSVCYTCIRNSRLHFREEKIMSMLGDILIFFVQLGATVNCDIDMNAIMIFKYFYTFFRNRYLFLACSQFIEANGSKIKNFGLSFFF